MVGEVLPANQVERVLRDYYAGKLGDADLEDRLLRDVDETHFREICQHALEGLASKKLNLEMLVERRAKAQEKRIVPETIARFLQDSAKNAALTLRPVNNRTHTFDPRSNSLVTEKARTLAQLEDASPNEQVSESLHRQGHRGEQQPGMGDPGTLAFRGAPEEQPGIRKGVLRQGSLLLFPGP